MIIALTGTPGVGKTTVAKELSKHFDVISLNSIVKKYRIKHGYDRKRKSKIIDIKKLAAAAKKESGKHKNIIIEGHLSHLLDAGLVVVLRCRPDVLAKRMKRKGWSENKIRENVMAEILDAITIEALEKSGKNVSEIDTTRKNAKQTAKLILNILNNHSIQNKYRAGKIDWTEKYSRMLLEK